MLLILLISINYLCVAQTITNVVSKQEGNNIIVSYNIMGGNSNKLYNPTLYYSLDGGVNYSKCRTVNAKLGNLEETNTITWNVTKDLDYFVGNNIIFKIEVQKNNWKRKLSERGKPFLITDKTIYTLARNIYALDRYTGEIKWEFSNKKRPWMNRAPVISNGMIFGQISNERIYALDMFTGSLKWEKRLHVKELSISKPYLIVHGNRLQAIDMLTGEIKWEGGDGVVDGFVEDNGIGYSATSTILSSFDLTSGELLWEAKSWFLYRLIINNDVIISVRDFYDVDDDHINVRDKNTGKLKWRYQWKDAGTVSSINEIIVKNGVIVLGRQNGLVNTIDLKTGKDKWRFKTGGILRTIKVAKEKGIVIVGGYDKNVYALDLYTGKEKWRIETSELQEDLSIDNGTVIFMIKDYLKGVDLFTGKEKWRHKDMGHYFNGISISNEVAFLGDLYGITAIDFSTPINPKTSHIYSYEIMTERGRKYKKAADINTIKSFEQFLSKNYKNKHLNNQAVSGIYKLTSQLDAVEGYREFLRKYPNANEAEFASKRLYEIFYAIAEEENELSSYYDYLLNFPQSQILLREKAFINMQILEVEDIQKKYDKKKKKDDDRDLKEQLAQQLYVEAIRAKEGGDSYTFIRKYNTVLYSDLFKDTRAAFDLFRDKELAKLIRGIQDEIRELRYSVESMSNVLLSKMNQINNSIQSSQSDNSYLLDKIYSVQKDQANDWSRFVNTGKGPKSIIGSPKRY